MVTRARLMGGAATLVLLGAVLAGVGTKAQAAVLPPGFAEQIVFNGLDQPTNIEFAPDGRIFVAEKGGVVKYFDNLADTTPTVFANLSANVHNQWDRGLLGMALAPNFPTDPWVYLLYTYDAPPGQTAPWWNDNCSTVPGGANGGNCVVQGRLSRIQSGGSEQVLIQDWCQQYPSHSIGDLRFGADGKLYVSGGDGASFNTVDYGQFGTPVNPCADPANEGGALRSQDIRAGSDPVTLDGAVLRLEPSTGLAAAGNPNLGSADLNARRTVAIGLRNPFRFTIRPGTNEVWLGDVGWGTWEEIDRIVNPVSGTTNFGWPCYEGAGRMSSYDNANLPLCESLYSVGTATAPYYSYNHANDIVPGEGCATGGDAIAGLAFYPGSGPYPAAYRNALFFADNARGCIWAMKPTTAGGLPSASNMEVFVKQAASPVDLAMGPGGELYYVDLGGTVRRIRYTPGNQSPVANISASPTSGPIPLAVSFNGTGSTDPDPADAGRLTYQWDFTNDGTWDATTAAASFTYHTAGVYTAKLRVTDTLGASGESTLQIQSGNSVPTAVIDSPALGTTFKVGDTISFSGHATDPQDGALPASALSWQLRLRHCETPGNCHTHVAQTFDGVASGQFVAPDHEYPSHLELELTARDSQSLANTVMRQINPQTVQLAFQSSPTGMQLSVGSFTGAAPFTREVIKGSTNTVSAPGPQAGYTFSAWSDGGAQTHVITAPDTPATYTATYVPVPAGACASSSAYQCTTATAPFVSAANQIGLGGDDSYTAVVLPFSMPLYGNSYSTAYIDTNGVVSFVNPGESKPANENLPSAALPNAAIYPFWDDLVVDGSASVRTESSGTSPHRKFVVEWRNVHVYGGSERVTFSTVLGEDGTITFHYSGIDATAFDRGEFATVGLENPAGNAALVYSHHQQQIETGKAITYTPPLAPLTNVVTGVVTQTGAGPAPGVTVTLNPGSTQTTTGADGTYTFTRVPAGSYTVTAGGACVNSVSAAVVMDAGTKTVNLTATSRSDSFGYQCSATTGPFVSAANVLGLSGDDNLTQITLPFPVPHYGTSYTTAWVDTNGYLSFASPGESRPMSGGLPDAVQPNAAVYGFWDDFVVDGQASIRTQTLGAAPNRSFVVEWRNVYFYSTTDRVTFSVALGEDGSFTMYYSGIDGSLRDRGESGTVGLENAAGTVAMQYSSHQILLGNGYIIRFWRL